MKKIIIFSSMALIMSCSFDSPRKNTEHATTDSIRIGDSIATLEREGKLVNPIDNSSIQTSRGYSDNPYYKPTISSNGKYHTIDGRARQIEFQGSLEQKQQLEMLDEYERNHSDY